MSFTQNQLPTFVKQPQNGKAQANNTTNTNVYTAGGNGTKVVGVIACSNHSAAVACTLEILNGSTLYPLGTANVIQGSGTSVANAAVNLLANTICPGLPVDSDGNPYILLVSGDSLQITLSAAVASPNVVSVTAITGDF